MTEITGFDALDAAADSIARLRDWAVQNDDLTLRFYGFGIWQAHAPKGTDLDQLTASILDGAEPDTVRKVERDGAVSIHRTFGPHPFHIELIIHLPRSEDVEESVTVLNPSDDRALAEATV